MKKLVVVFAVAAVFAAAAAVVVGNLRAREVHTEIVDALGQKSDANVLESSFTPGLLGSKSVVTFALDPSDAGEAKPVVGFRMENDIQHGAMPVLAWLGSGADGTPVIARVETRLTLDGELAEPIREGLGELPTLEIHTSLRASGVGESRLHMKPIQAEGEDVGGAFGVDWKGLDGQIVYTRDFGKFAGKVEAHGLEVNSALAELRMVGFSWTADFDTDASGLHVGSAATLLESFELRPILLPMPVMSVAKVEMIQESRVEGGRYSATLENRFESIQAGEGSWGPGVMNFELRNLDAPSMAEFSETVQQVQARIQAGEEGEELQAEFGQKIVAALPGLAAHSPELEMSEILLTTPDGTVRGKAAVKLDGSDPQLLQNPMFAIAALSAKASAEAPADLFAAAIEMWATSQVKSGKVSMVGDFDQTVDYIRDSMIHNLRKAGYVVFDGERYRTRVDWSQGQLTINGMPVNPMELGMLAAGGGIAFPEDDEFGDFDDTGLGFPASLAN